MQRSGTVATLTLLLAGRLAHRSEPDGSTERAASLLAERAARHMPGAHVAVVFLQVSMGGASSKRGAL